MKVLVNKTFNTEYFSEYLNTTLKPNSKVFSSGEFKIYDNATTGTTVVDGVFPQVLFAPQSYLDIIDALNTASYNNTLDLAGLSFDLVINTLYATDRTSRNYMIDYLLGLGLCSATQASQAKNLVSVLGSFDPANILVEYNSVDDVYSYSFNTPVELLQPYDVSNNVGESGLSEKLYLVMLTQISTAYGDVLNVNGGTGSYSPVHKFYNPVLDTTVLQSSYIATELGDINDTESNPDLKYDHMDKIDYIDSFRMRFKLPRVIA